jgi:hypothetical protein
VGFKANGPPTITATGTTNSSATSPQIRRASGLRSPRRYSTAPPTASATPSTTPAAIRP